jgi:hypothetical protein
MEFNNTGVGRNKILMYLAALHLSLVPCLQYRRTSVAGHIGRLSYSYEDCYVLP